MRDADYPRPNYALTYDQTIDLLEGAYFQAVLGQTLEVAFVRLQPVLMVSTQFSAINP